MKQNLAHDLSEQGFVPDSLIRQGIRRLLKQRLSDIQTENFSQAIDSQREFLQTMRAGNVAEVPEKANEQHYELPTEFFEKALGKHLKYSCAYWNDGTASLNDAEELALAITCKRAELRDGMQILELGCGWGSLTLWMAENYPNSEITAVSNSKPQGNFIRARAAERSLNNIRVITADMNEFSAKQRFDRVVSLEMFEHMRNWERLFQRVSDWLSPEGKLFIHIFVHRNTPYLFEDKDKNDWMSRHFFSGGMMPSADLPLQFQEHLQLADRWIWNGQHYEATCNAWLNNMDKHRSELWPVFETTYGKDFAKVWWMRWRMFFMACAELFSYNQGQEWMVGHYLFNNRKGS